MTDQNLPAMPATEAAGEAAMRDRAELLVARARDEGRGADRRARVVDGAGPPGPPDRPPPLVRCPQTLVVVARPPFVAGCVL